MASPLPIVVLISGSGTNLQAIIDDAIDNPNYFIAAVISNKAGVKGLDRAKSAGISTEVLSHKAFDSRENYDQALIQCIDQYTPGLVVLAGFMRILTAGFVEHYQGRMLNIHPSLLPAYTGLNTHQRVLDANEPMHGASVHFVTEELDGGPVVLQASLNVNSSKDADELAARILTLEHIIYPTVINWFSENRLNLTDQGIEFDKQLIKQPLQLDEIGSP